MIRYFYRPIFWLARAYWLVSRPRTRGATAIICYKDEILLVKNTYGKGRWLFPGGGVEKKELPEQAVRREIKEELGISMTEVNLLGTHFFTDNFKKDTVWFFESHVDTRSVQPNKKEIAEAEWFRRNKLPTNLAISAVRGLALLNTPH
jgi:8-oxo-dGTP diphosphatase